MQQFEEIIQLFLLIKNTEIEISFKMLGKQFDNFLIICLVIMGLK